MSVTNIWSVDGIEWRIPCTVERTSEMTPSEISGMLLDRSYFNDVLGTYMKYDIKVEIPLGMEDSFAQLYDQITQPVDGHVFVLPYQSGIITVTGRVESVRDVFTRLRDGTNRWSGITFQIIANHPTKEYSLGEILLRGATPLPDPSDVDIGASYTYTANGWDIMDSAEDFYY